MKPFTQRELATEFKRRLKQDRFNKLKSISIAKLTDGTYVEHKDKLVIPNDMPQTKDAYFGLAEIAFGLAVFVGLSYFIINVVNK